ncbi:hypothetical protein IG631_20802 [Alternaria alternata]|nr:hypothetical protein IG631_20802 [Alternaria alternata]
MGARSWVDPFDAEAVTLYFKRLGAKKSHRDTADEYGRVHVGSVRSTSKAREGGCRVRGASASTTCASRGSSLCCEASLCEACAAGQACGGECGGIQALSEVWIEVVMNSC